MEAAQPTNAPHTTRNPLTLLIRWFAGLFGDRAREIERFIKFAIVGTVGAGVDFGKLNLLEHTVLVPEGAETEVRVRVAAATGIAFTTAVISNFIWNRYWTFPDSRSRRLAQQLAQFFIVSVVGLVFRLIFVPLTFRFFGGVGASVLDAMSAAGPLGETAINQLGSNIAQAIAIIIVLFWNFFANRFWTFNDVE